MGDYELEQHGIAIWRTIGLVAPQASLVRQFHVTLRQLPERVL